MLAEALMMTNDCIEMMAKKLRQRRIKVREMKSKYGKELVHI